MSIAVRFIQFAADEGSDIAIRELEDLREELEVVAEIGSEDERKAAAFLYDSTEQAMKEILDGGLVDVARHVQAR